MARHYRWLVIITLLTAFCVWVSLPDTTGIDWDNDGELNLVVQQRLGLDLVGGVRVLLEAQLPPGSFTAEDLQRAAENVNKRVNGLGLTEATVQVQGSNRILVELPGVTDKRRAVETIKATALLEFVDFAYIPNVRSLDGARILTDEQNRLLRARGEQAPADLLRRPDNGQPFTTIMTGAELRSAAAQFDPQTNSFYISVELNDAAANQFSAFTGARIGQPMAIVLDSEVISAPTIQAQLGSRFIIEGKFSQEEANTLALQLRSGALPIPLREEAASDVGATLGQESVALSIRAGIIGVLVVLMFMLTYYRVPGAAADIALIVFALLNFAAYKLIPVTITLPAITGFLISIGTAVDGNILIFERIKEELRAGRPLGTALDLGFNRAWGSIRDSNISTIIICIILFFFGQTPGASAVSGFAITLIIGLVINLFTAVIVTRTFLYIFASWLQKPLSEKKWLMGI
jgi:protein-export membrane protein SecD